MESIASCWRRRMGCPPVFREYMAVYIREQATCFYSEELLINLEKFWNARTR